MSESITISNTEYPKDWDIVRLGDASINITDGSHFSPKNDKNGEYRIATVANIIENHIDIDSCKKISKEDYEMLVKNGCKPKKGDVLFSKDGTVGLSFTFRQKEDIVLLSSIAIISPKESLYSDYCAYVLKSPFVFQQIVGSKRGTGLRRIILQDLKRIKIPLPPLPEQRRIAEVLGTVDSAIQKVGGAIEKTERLKKGLMQRLLTKGIGHERFKETEIGRVPEEWEAMRLGDVLELCQYGLSVKMEETGKYPIIKMDDIVNGIVIPDKVKYIDLDEKTFKNFKLEKGDILFNRTNSYELVGRTGIFLLRGDYVFASYLIRLRPKKEIVDSQFLTFYMVFSNDRIRQQLATRAVHQANINATNLQNYNIPLPPLPEQRRIAEILSAVDRKLELERRRKGKLSRVKKGLMNELLTGRKRVMVENDGSIYK